MLLRKGEGKEATAAAKAGLASMKVRVETGAPSSALEPVVGELEGLVQRLDQEAASEQKHKDWCVHERTVSLQKRDRHQGIVTQLTKSIADTKETISDKELSIQDNSDAVSKADSDFADLENLRSKAKSDFEAEYQDYQDAITALAQAGEMLTEFYRSGEALLQERAMKRMKQPSVPEASVKVDTPEMGSLSGEYEQKGGPAGVLSTTRQEFETGAAALQESERQQEAEFAASKTAYTEARNSLVQAGNQLTVELQTAQASLASDEQNLQSNEAEVTAAQQYLAQVGASCDSLEAHFDDRQALRGQERTALTDAIAVLKAS